MKGNKGRSKSTSVSMRVKFDLLCNKDLSSKWIKEWCGDEPEWHDSTWGLFGMLAMPNKVCLMVIPNVLLLFALSLLPKALLACVFGFLRVSLPPESSLPDAFWMELMSTVVTSWLLLSSQKDLLLLLPPCLPSLLHSLQLLSISL